MTKLYTRGDLARAARLTNQGIKHAEIRGEIQPVAKTVGGISLFNEKQVEKFLESRKQSDRK